MSNSFLCHQDRVPFVVPERVQWRMMCSTLNSKFTSEVETKHNLDQYNQHFLAQKIFDKPDTGEDFSNVPVSWAQFNKVHTVVRFSRRHTQADIRSNLTVPFNPTGGSPGSTIHFLAVVWRSDGADQEAPEELLERRVRRSLWYLRVKTSNLLRFNNNDKCLLCFAPVGWYLASLGSSICTWFSETGPMELSCFALVTLRSEASPLHMCLLLRVSIGVDLSLSLTVLSFNFSLSDSCGSCSDYDNAKILPVDSVLTRSQRQTYSKSFIYSKSIIFM